MPGPPHAVAAGASTNPAPAEEGHPCRSQVGKDRRPGEHQQSGQPNQEGSCATTRTMIASTGSRRAGAAPDPRDADRPDGSRHHPCAVRLGMAELPAVLHPARATSITSLLVDEEHPQQLQPRHGAPARPAGRRHRSAGRGRGCSARTRLAGLAGTVRFDWAALDAWFEEDERSSSTRATRTRGSTRCARAASSASNSTASCWPSHRRPSWSSRPGCRPATTSTGPTWTSTTSARPTPRRRARTRAARPATGRYGRRSQTYPDLAWTYDFPTRQLLPIAGLIAFYNEKVDIVLDGVLLDRPSTHFFR